MNGGVSWGNLEMMGKSMGKIHGEFTIEESSRDLMENPWEIFLGNRWTSDGKSGNHGHNVADSSILGHGCG